MEELIKKCKCGVYLEVNPNRDIYYSVEQYIKEENMQEENIDNEVAERMIKENTVISLQFYPHTPVGFYKVYGTSLDEVVKKALSCFE